MSDLSDLSDDLGDAMPLVDLSERYKIQETLGKGGMGVVLRALDTRLNRPVAIKRVLGEMARSKKALSRFLTEAQAIASLNHFNIVQIYDYGHDAEGPFIIMELVEGESLQQKLKAGPLAIDEAIEMACQLCDGLAIAHEQGIVHRDIKPANILLTGRGEPKLTDFGLARQETADHGQTKTGVVLGTIDFMPPEQRRDATATDARSDLWSLAATIYQMITGSSPKVIRLDQIPANIAPVLGKMLEEIPDKRYATAADFKTALREGVATVTTTVSAELSAGVCPACQAPNDVGRKFCRGCGNSLQLQCLQCKATLPAWEVFCGECGTNQENLRQSLQAKFDGILQQAEQQFSHLKFDTALSLLAPVLECDHEFAAETIKRAETLAARIGAEQQRQQQLIDQVQQLAAQYRQEYEFVKALHELKKIPQPLQTRAIKEQVKEIQQVRSEVHTLRSQIKDAIQKRKTFAAFDQKGQMQGLLALTTRYLELHPVHEKIAQIHQKLLAREGGQFPVVQPREASAGIQIKGGEGEGTVASRKREEKKEEKNPSALIGNVLGAIVIGMAILRLIMWLLQDF
ncbi:MAG TPA: hypothetical protein EYN70_06910 [Planctomycetaceae bacterium]|nr:hypothetical protein [Planctomycetaceae bacterium]